MPMRLRKALVPLAGRGTRHFPASLVVKKELFPLLGPDGVMRPLLHYQLRDLVRSGFTEIGVIVRPGEDRIVRAYFAGPGEAYLKALAGQPALLAEVEEMRQILDCLHFIEQAEPEGFGHAVYQGRKFAGGEAVLLCTGDILYRGPCHREMVAACAAEAHRSISAVCRLGPSQLHGYGTIAGRRLAPDPRLIEITRILEKPSPAAARQHLRVDGLPPETWLGWFGLHALAPSIYEILEEMITDDLRDGGEIQLTRAQDLQRQRHGYRALEMTTSERFDFGLPTAYLESVAGFARA